MMNLASLSDLLRINRETAVFLNELSSLISSSSTTEEIVEYIKKILEENTHLQEKLKTVNSPALYGELRSLKLSNNILSSCLFEIKQALYDILEKKDSFKDSEDYKHYVVAVLKHILVDNLQYDDIIETLTDKIVRLEEYSSLLEEKFSRISLAFSDKVVDTYNVIDTLEEVNRNANRYRELLLSGCILEARDEENNIVLISKNPFYRKITK